MISILEIIRDALTHFNFHDAVSTLPYRAATSTAETVAEVVKAKSKMYRRLSISKRT
jgi:hypothetical protein